MAPKSNHISCSDTCNTCSHLARVRIFEAMWNTGHRMCLRGRMRLKCDGTRVETTFRLSAKRTSPFKPAGGVSSVDYWQPSERISGSNAGYTMFRGSVKSTGYPLHSPASPSLLDPCVTVCHHVSTGLYRAVRRSQPKSL
jgi:hypothetical protein